MSVERTLSIIKPDAVAKNVIGQIVARFEAKGRFSAYLKDIPVWVINAAESPALLGAARSLQ